MHVLLQKKSLLIFISAVLFFGCSKNAEVKKDAGASITKPPISNLQKVMQKTPSDSNKEVVVKKDVRSEDIEGEKLISTSLTSNDKLGSGDKEAIEIQNKLYELQKVYFDYDKSDIRNDAKNTLNQNAEILKDNEINDILIEGHCDERGTEEYNLALGLKRAENVKKYLTTLGISDVQMNTISYGESKPEVSGSDESAWKWNRRAILKEIKE